MHDADRARRVGESGQVQGVRLADAARGQHGAVENDQHTVLARIRTAGDRDGVAEVARPVGVRDVGGPLRPGENDGPAVAVDEVEQDGGLLERVGAVRDDDPVHVVALELPAHRLGDRPHVGQRHEVRTDPQNFVLLDGGACVELDAGEHRGSVIDGDHGSTAAAGRDRSSAGEDDDMRHGGGLLRSWRMVELTQ
jgi:hypothetical protein